MLPGKFTVSPSRWKLRHVWCFVFVLNVGLLILTALIAYYYATQSTSVSTIQNTFDASCQSLGSSAPVANFLSTSLSNPYPVANGTQSVTSYVLSTQGLVSSAFCQQALTQNNFNGKLFNSVSIASTNIFGNAIRMAFQSPAFSPAFKVNDNQFLVDSYILTANNFTDLNKFLSTFTAQGSLGYFTFTCYEELFPSQYNDSGSILADMSNQCGYSSISLNPYVGGDPRLYATLFNPKFTSSGYPKLSSTFVCPNNGNSKSGQYSYGGTCALPLTASYIKSACDQLQSNLEPFLCTNTVSNTWLTVISLTFAAVSFAMGIIAMLVKRMCTESLTIKPDALVDGEPTTSPSKSVDLQMSSMHSSSRM